MFLLKNLLNSKNKYHKILNKIINLIIKHGVNIYVDKFKKKIKNIEFKNNIKNDNDFIKACKKIIKIYHIHSEIETKPSDLNIKKKFVLLF
jgi:predicted peroxiredoxin